MYQFIYIVAKIEKVYAPHAPSKSASVPQYNFCAENIAYLGVFFCSSNFCNNCHIKVKNV